MSERLLGYARISSGDQHFDRQINALREFGVSRELIFADCASGKNFDRHEYKKLKETLVAGDVVVVKSIDRLGRNYDEVLEEWRIITRKKNASIVVLDMPLLDTRNVRDGITGVLISDIVLELLSYVAHVERENIRQRQAEGIAAAHARGVKFGRPPKQRPVCYAVVKRSYVRGSITRQEAARRLGVCPTTFSRWLKSDFEHEGHVA